MPTPLVGCSGLLVRLGFALLLEQEVLLPRMPLRPGVYWWHVSLSDEGESLDAWHCVPEMIVATEPLGHPRDEWTGVLNLGCEFATRLDAPAGGR